MKKLRDLRGASSPQAIKLLNLTSHNINMTPFNNHLIISKIFIILFHIHYYLPFVLLLCKYLLQPVCTFFLHIPAYIIIFVIILFYILFFIILYSYFLLNFVPYLYSLVFV